MKWLKKVAATPLTSIAKVIDGFNGANKNTNAPSIRAVEDALNGKASTGDLMTLSEELNAEIATKATKAELESATSELETALDDKVDTLDFQNYQVQIQEQIAIVKNETDNKLATKADRTNMIISRDYSYNYEITAGSYAQISAANLGIIAISGYTPICFRKLNSGSRYINITNMQAVAQGTVVNLTNTNNATVSGTLSITLVFARNDVRES